ncbi:MAG: hypothetical protein SO170_01185 [Butyribacter sp.]|nr:hypothetical protein [bacterium]MDY3853564.1 hypothetical protein [Butyribacter sp.]
MIGILYFFAFQLLGMISIRLLFSKETNGFCILLGSVAGSFFLQWLPVIFAFFFGFGYLAHGLVILTAFCLFLMILCYRMRQKTSTSGREVRGNQQKETAIVGFHKGNVSIFQLIKKHPCAIFIGLLYLYMVVVLWHHTLTVKDGAYMTGQCTYGDMNMHLGFITSIARQGIFPPEYSILPGTRLAYPFLSDSISSSLYLLGTSLKLSYLIPMYIALLQVFFGVYLLAQYLLKDKWKPFLACILFFLNGGFGICYFISNGFQDTNFTRIFTEFYQTPTNYVDQNIQWHNVLVDMLIPQRATLFGWAILFPLLYLLIKAWKEQKQWYFIPAGILAGGLPLIHTHSFLALGVLCCGFLLLNAKENIVTKKKSITIWMRIVIMAVILTVLSLLSIKMNSDAPLGNNIIFAMGLILIIAFLAYLVYVCCKGFSKQLLLTWGVFLAVVLALALPQLLAFTFRQAVGEQFTRGGFNWANSGDNYIIFAIKNYGIMFFLVIAVFLSENEKQKKIMLPSAFLWLISEFIIFQPNVYDNNKLLLVAYLFFCIAVSDFICDKLQKIRESFILYYGGIALLIFLGSISAILTMAREAVSEYELYSKGYAEAAAFIEKETKPSDLLLTATNHNNAVASLTGRNIVCGSSSFLYYHGVDYAQNEADVKTMYEDSEKRDALLEQYGVDYIVLGPNELFTYLITDYKSMLEKYPVCFQKDDVVILKVTDG